MVIDGGDKKMLKNIRFILNFYIQRIKNICFLNMNLQEMMHCKQKKLYKMVRYAVAKSGFYAKLYEGLCFKGKANIEDLPIITKQDIVDNFEQILTVKNASKKSLKTYFEEPFDFEKRYKKKYLAFHTSGSTGTPIYVLWGENVFGISLSNYFFRIRSIVDKGATKKLKVAYIGITDDYVGGNSWVYGMKKFANIKIISIFSPKEKLISQLNEFQPDIVFTKPSLLGELARKKKDGLLNIQPKNLIFAGEMISPVDLKCIQQYFGLKPINSYSTCETGPVAIQTDIEKDGLSIFEDIVWVELVDDNNNVIHDDYQVGSVVITNLYNKYLPIIRYKIGDKAYYIPCEDEKSGKRLSYIQGRGTSFFIFKDENGESVNVAEFPFWSLYVPGIQRYQVIQTSYYELQIKIEYEQPITEEVHDISENFIRKLRRILAPYNLEDIVKIVVVQVEKIYPNSTGKIQVTKPLKE